MSTPSTHADDRAEQKVKSRRGSETRKRVHQVGVRLNPEEQRVLAAESERTGQTVADLLRSGVFGECGCHCHATPKVRTDTLEALLAAHRYMRVNAGGFTGCRGCAWRADAPAQSERAREQHEAHVADQIRALTSAHTPACSGPHTEPADGRQCGPIVCVECSADAHDWREWIPTHA